MAIVHEFAWSVSRHGNFAECRRRYFYDYYRSWRGWERDADPERKRTYLLKKMTRLPMHAGTSLHDALAWWFERRAAGADPGREEVARRAIDQLRKGWVDSRDGHWRKRPARITHLAEHHFEEACADEPSGRAREYGGEYVERIEKGVDFFFDSPDLEPVRSAEPSTYLACEELGTIELFDTKVYAVPDFALRRPDGEVWIYDWKSGRPRDADAFQLALYALYAEDVWGADPTAAVLVDAYLPEARIVRATKTRAELDELRATVSDSMAAMRTVHFDADSTDGDPEDFPLIPEGSPEARTCGRCNYRELCGR